MSTAIVAQSSNCYDRLPFKQFLTDYASDPLKYKQEFYKNLRFPAAESIKGKEGVVKVTLINHSKDSTEVLLSGLENELFREEVYRVLEIVNSKFFNRSDAKYFTEFYVQFDLEPFEDEDECVSNPECNLIRVIKYKPLIKHSKTN